MGRFKDFISELLVNSKIYAWADDRERFSVQAEKMFPRIAEDVCLIIYALENNFPENYINYWTGRLSGNIDILRRRKTAGDKRKIFRSVLKGMNHDIGTISTTVSGKLSREHFDGMSEESCRKILVFLNSALPDICCGDSEDETRELVEKNLKAGLNFMPHAAIN